MPTVLSEMTDEEVAAGLREHGSVAALARARGIAESTLRDEVRRRGMLPVPARRRGIKAPSLTRESLHRALEPPNNCKVKTFLDALDGETLAVVEEALGYAKEDFPAGAFRDWLIDQGFRAEDIPGAGSVNDHRAGRRPCRCKG